jgi:peptidoglycan/LPS O-acetylase OafA/YrhL
MPIVTLGALYSSRVLLPPAYHYSIGFTVDAMLMATLIVQLMQLSTRSGWGWLNSPVTRYFGALSYSLYLYHGWGMSVATHLGDHGKAFTVVAAFGAAIVLAAGSYYLVERPFLRLKRRFEEPRAATLQALAPVASSASDAATATVANPS